MNMFIIKKLGKNKEFLRNKKINRVYGTIQRSLTMGIYALGNLLDSNIEIIFFVLGYF